jgi:hypothetical protein
MLVKLIKFVPNLFGIFIAGFIAWQLYMKWEDLKAIVIAIVGMIVLFFIAFVVKRLNTKNE